MLYSLLIEANLSEAARKAIEMEPGLVNFFSEAQRQNFERGQAKGKAQGKAEGKAEGEAAALLKILMRRGLRVTAEQRRRIVACRDLAMLERWLDRSLSVSSVNELWASPKTASRRVHRRGQPVIANGRRRPQGALTR